MRRFNNEKGMALVIVLLVIVVVSVMGLSMMAMAANNMKMSTGDRNYQSSYYIAEAGAASRLNEISLAISSTYKTSTTLSDFFTNVDAALQLNTEKIFNNFEESFGSNPSAKVKIEKLTGDTIISYSNDYKITSTGVVDNRKRTVSRIVHVTWKPKSKITIPGDTVLFAKDGIGIANTPISGSIATNATKSGGGVKITGNGSNINESQINYNVNTSVNLPEFPAFQIPANANNFSATQLTMRSDMAFKLFTVNSNTTLTIDVGDYNRNLVIQNLTLLQNAKIKIIGKGKLSIFVKDINLDSGTIINVDGDKNKLYMFLEGSGASLNSGVIYGSMYVNDKFTTLNVNTTTGIQGHIITKSTNIDLKGNPINYPRMIFAPDAAVTIDATFSGSIIAKNIVSKGANTSGKYEYVKIDYENSPIYVETNGSVVNPTQDVIVYDSIKEQ